MKFGKRQLVLAALVVALGAAVYLNWQFADNSNMLTATTSNTGKELGQAQFVNNSTDGTAGKDAGNSDDSKEKKKSTAKASEDSLAYFTQSKVERQKTQDEITDLAKEVIEAAASSEDARTEAIAQTAQIAKVMEQQSNIESLIKAKGFTECFAFIQNGECSIVVCKGELSDDKVIVIKDIVAGQSGIEFDNIKITEV